MLVKYLIQILFLLGVLVPGIGAFASEIKPKSGQQIRYLPSHIDEEDFLYLNPPNESGISVNQFSSFDLDKSLKLMNTPSYNKETGDPISSSRLIVISAPEILLESVIDVVGPATDILFVTNMEDDGLITCNSCVVNNVLRLTLASAYSSNIDSEMNSVGALTSMGILNIKSLYAPGAVGLGLVAGQVVTSGEINLNQEGIKSSAGGYSALPGGQYEIGSGAIDLLSGGVIWHYENQKINRIYDSGSQYSIAGQFKAPRVHISATPSIKFTGQIDTRVDALSAVSYQGATHVPQIGAVVQALSNGSGTGVDVTISGDIYTDNVLDVRATRDINIQASAKVSATSSTFLAGRALSNKAEINGGTVSMAGDELINEGFVDAKNEISLWADKDLANQYGGVLRGEKIVLVSENRVVRNGSRTPYRSEDNNRNNFLSLDNSEILASLNNIMDFDPSSVNSSELGAFYLLPGSVNLVEDATVELPVKHSAHIVGGTVQIKAKAFENINPYYEKVVDQDLVFLNREFINQVSVSAEDLLEVQGADSDSESRAEYVLNASGLMAVNSAAGKMRVQSYRFINQRYRIATYFSRIASSREGETGTYVTSNYTSGNGFGSKTKIFSPPGFLSVMGRLEMNSSDYFANIMGYVEVFNSADFNSAILKNIGVENQGVVTETTYISTVFDTNPGGSQSRANVAKDPRELDSLFAVSGELRASATDSWFGVLNPFYYFITEAIEARSEDVFPLIAHHLSGSNVVNCSAEPPGCESRVFERDTLEVTVDPEAALANIDSDKIVFDYSVRIERKFGGMFGESPSRYMTASGTEELSLMETLEEYFDLVKEKLTELVEEFDWWGLAE